MSEEIRKNSVETESIPKPPETESVLDVIDRIHRETEQTMEGTEEANARIFDLIRDADTEIPSDLKNFAIDVARRTNTIRRTLWERLSEIREQLKAESTKVEIEDTVLEDINAQFLSPEDTAELLKRAKYREKKYSKSPYSGNSQLYVDSKMRHLVLAAEAIDTAERKDEEEDRWNTLAEQTKQLLTEMYIRKLEHSLPKISHSTVERDALQAAVMHRMQETEKPVLEYNTYLEKNFDIERAIDIQAAFGPTNTAAQLLEKNLDTRAYRSLRDRGIEDTVASLGMHRTALEVAGIPDGDWKALQENAETIEQHVSENLNAYLEQLYQTLHAHPESCIQAFKALLQVSTQYYSPAGSYQSMSGIDRYVGEEKVREDVFTYGLRKTIPEILKAKKGVANPVQTPEQLQQVIDFLQGKSDEFEYAQSIVSLFVKRLNSEANEDRSSRRAQELKGKLHIEQMTQIEKFGEIFGDVSDPKLLQQYVALLEKGIDPFQDIQDIDKYRYVIGLVDDTSSVVEQRDELNHMLRRAVETEAPLAEAPLEAFFVRVLAEVSVERLTKWLPKRYPNEAEHIRAAIKQRDDKELSYTTLEVLAPYISKERLILIATQRPMRYLIAEMELSHLDPAEIQDVLVQRSNRELADASLEALSRYLKKDQLIDIAREKPIHAVITEMEAVGFSTEEIQDVLEERTDEELAKMSLELLAPYVVNKERLVAIAKNRHGIYLLDEMEASGLDLNEIRGVLTERSDEELSAFNVKKLLTYISPDRVLKTAELRSTSELIRDAETYLELIHNTDIPSQSGRLLVVLASGKRPELRHVFHDVTKLGTKLTVITERLGNFGKQLMSSGLDASQVILEIEKKLVEIKKIYSTDSSVTDRILIFAEGFHARDKDGTEVKVDEGVLESIREEVIDILLKSGCEDEHSFRQRQLQNPSLDSTSKEQLAEKIEAAEMAMQQADTRNRALVSKMAGDKEDVAKLLIPPNAYTHGFPSSVVSNVLDTGIMCGELLGSSAAGTDFSGLFGTDTCMVPADGWESKETVQERLALGNEVYGNIVAIMNNYPDQSTREPWHAKSVSEHHYNIPYGIPTSEISSLVIKEDTVDVERVCDSIAWKGLYIPVVDMNGTLLFTPESFDERANLFSLLKGQGYELEIAVGIVDYISQSDTLSKKHQVVLGKTVEAIQAGMKVELVPLIETMRDDSLNWHDDTWYEEQPFEVIYDFFKKDRTRLAQREVRKRLFGDEQADAVYRRDTTKLREEPVRTYHAHLDAFLDRQVSNADIDRKDIESSLADVLMRDIRTDRIFAAAEQVTAVKAEALKRGLEQAWKQVFEVQSDVDADTLERIRRQLVPVMSGSLGRSEAVLGSDLDFLFLFDDTAPDAVDRAQIKQVVDASLTPALNSYLESLGIRPDAGLAKADRNPFVALSDIRSFTIDLGAHRQTEEPTELLDMQPIDATGEALVANAKHALLVENADASSKLVSYIERDLEVGSSDRPSFTTTFESLYQDFSSGVELSKIKESMQRTATFKVYDLIARAFTSEFGVSESEAASVPGPLPEKISWLETHGILSQEEGKICKDTLAVAYKLRLMSEFFSEESEVQKDDDIPAKVKDSVIEKRMLSFEDRRDMFSAITKFRNTVLYK